MIRMMARERLALSDDHSPLADRTVLSPRYSPPTFDKELAAAVRLNLGLFRRPDITVRAIKQAGSFTGALTDFVAVLVASGLSPEKAKEALARVAAVPDGAAEDEISRAERRGVAIVPYGAAGYPKALLQVPCPPIVLYMKGTSYERNALAVSVVGARAASEYGRTYARAISKELAQAGVVVVSGLARGIDAAAHEGALLGGGPTYAVLGNGIDVVYPATHKGLAEKIAENGALISEYPFGTPPLPYHFPQRNRIIAGFGHGTFVVQASEKSGSLITARFALAYDRDVYALPGDSNRANARGTNALIRAGATLVESASDLLALLPRDRMPSRKPGSKKPSGPDPASIDPLGPALLQAMSADELEPLDLILSRIGAGTGDGAAEISQVEATPALMALEIAGLVRQGPGGLYKKAS